ncbi:HD domain-containing phosphohydrolase [Exiguobacterium aestuarii]|uniref:HD domain-containing phosphohydrolase n=1 Tax=Exiguobacterium aestuarii TaxID=273527 RepID=A0ABW2PHP2_9BACL|nr:HD domain-containing phosphohydrolase [Exiguobacterium aestuarii]MCT4786638.1 diguanylate cyclase [Exiguobacterium aestuarii]
MTNPIHSSYDTLLRYMPQGYVEFKVIYDDASEPIDYEFFEVNPAFEKMMKGKRKHFIGQKVSAALKDFEYSEREWMIQVARVVSDGGTVTFEHFSRRNKSWYEMSVFSERKGFVSVMFHDITRHVQENNALKQLVNVSHRFVSTGSDLLMNQQFLDQIRDFTGAKAVALNLMESDGESYTTVALSGMDEMLERSLDVLGFHPVGKKWPMTDQRRELFSRSNPQVFEGIDPLIDGALPKRLVKNLLRIFSLGEVVLFKIEKDGILYGDLTIVMQEGKVANRLGLVELYLVHVLEQLIKADRQVGETKKSMFDGFATLDLECIMAFHTRQILHLNDTWERVLGYSLDEMENMDFLSLIHPDDDGITEAAFAELEERGELFRFVNRFRTIDDTYRSIEWHCKLQGNYIYAVAKDVTDRVQLEEKLAERDRLLTKLSDQIPGAIYQFELLPDGSFNFPFFSRGFEDMLGITAEEVQSDAGLVFRRMHPDDYPHVMQSIDESYRNLTIWDAEFRVLAEDGRTIWILGSSRPEKIADGHVLWHGYIGDVTEKKKYEKEIEYLSYHDQLTGAKNRRYFEEALERYDDDAFYPLSLIVIDINGLKLTNDAFGHLIGDRLLVEAANILRNELRAKDEVARIGGDEFVVISPNTTLDEAKQLSDRLSRLFLGQTVEGLPISASFGEAVKHDAEIGLTDVFNLAEDRMYHHKVSEKQSRRHHSIQLIMRTLYEKIPREEAHSQRVANLSGKLAEAMGFTSAEVNEIRTAAILHDIGKVAISNDILDKPGALTEPEWREIKRHPEVSYNILSTVPEYVALSEIVLSHHERWDGKGYPKGISEYEIPLASRIISIADTFDVMVTGRPYRQAKSIDEALAIIKEEAGKQFDPTLVDVFFEKVVPTLQQ